jgi:hypothetical protein
MKFLILSLLLSTAASAETYYKIGGELVGFKSVDGLLLKGCETKCDALQAVKKFNKINLTKARAKETFEASVGSDVCRLIYKANSVIGVTQEKDQRAFCVFKDSSLIEINSLTEYLAEKKIITK